MDHGDSGSQSEKFMIKILAETSRYLFNCRIKCVNILMASVVATALCSCAVNDTITVYNQTGSDVSLKAVRRGGVNAIQGSREISSNKLTQPISLGAGGGNHVEFEYSIKDESQVFRSSCLLEGDDSSISSYHYIAWLDSDSGSRVICKRQSADSD